MKWRRFSRCRRFAGFALAALVVAGACKSQSRARERDAGQSRAHVDAGPPYRLASNTREPGTATAAERRYYDGYLAETLHGDTETARAAYRAVIATAGKGAPTLAARAALRLASLESLAGRRREAQELVARASVLGRRDPSIVEQADRIQTHLASIRSRGSEVRGPPAGTPLAAVSAEASKRFADAEKRLSAYHRMQLQPRLEALRASVAAKEHAMEQVVRAYRHVVALAEPGATAPAEFRIASVYQDLALALMFDLPPELEPLAAARLRRSLRANALSNLRRARVAYKRSVEASAKLAPALAARWRLAAESGLRSVEDLLGVRD